MQDADKIPIVIYINFVDSYFLINMIYLFSLLNGKKKNNIQIASEPSRLKDFSREISRMKIKTTDYYLFTSLNRFL